MLAIAWARTSIAVEPPITAIEVATEHKIVFTASQSGLTIRRMQDLKPLKTLDCGLDHIHDLALSLDGQQLLVSGGSPAEVGIVQCRRVPGLQLLWENRDADDVVTSLAWEPTDETNRSQQSTRFAAASWDRMVRTYRVEKQLPSLECVYTGHSAPVSTVAFLERGLVLSAGSDETLQVWQWTKESSAGKQTSLVRNLHQHTAGVITAAVQSASSTSAKLWTASSSEDRTVRVWDAAAGRMLRFKKWPTVPQSLAWIPQTKRLVVGCEDGELAVMDATDVSFQRVTKLSGPVSELIIESDGKSCLAVVGSSVIRSSLPD
ncbi:MAG: hypothetical protein U0892_21395 [Pirellulales bacterium]